MVGLFVVAVVLAMFFGLVAVTANAILIGLAAGLLIGLLFMALPLWSIWLILVAGLLIVGLLPLWVDFLASKSAWGVSLLGFLLFLGAIYKLLTTPDLTRTTPAFIWVALIFFLFTVVNSLAQWHSAGEFLGGLKRYFQIWGLMFAMAWIVGDGKHFRRWKAFLLIAALVQLPFAVYELIEFVPRREAIAMSLPGLVPIDVVAGTFGAGLYTGGANAEMATFLIIVLAFMLAHSREKTLPKKYLFLLLPILAPLFLGETKVVVILLPLMFLVLYRRELIMRPHYGILGLVVGGLLTFAAGYAYLSLSEKSLDDQIADTLEYNVYKKGYGNFVLNRTTVLSFWLEQQGSEDPVSFVLGNGLGSAQTISLAPGHVADRYPRYGIGLTAASTLLWETGVMGFGLFITMLYWAWRCAERIRRYAQDPAMRADASAIQATIALFAFYLFYRISLLDNLAFQIVFASVLGYLAWLHRQLPRVATTHADRQNNYPLT